MRQADGDPDSGRTWALCWQIIVQKEGTDITIVAVAIGVVCSVLAFASYWVWLAGSRDKGEEEEGFRLNTVELRHILKVQSTSRSHALALARSLSRARALALALTLAAG